MQPTSIVCAVRLLFYDSINKKNFFLVRVVNLFGEIGVMSRCPKAPMGYNDVVINIQNGSVC